MATESRYTCGAVCPYMRNRACTLEVGHFGSHSDGNMQWNAPPMDPRRESLLDPARQAPPLRVEQWILPFGPTVPYERGRHFSCEIAPQFTFRPRRLRTNVTDAGQVIVEQLYVGGLTPGHAQFTGEIDAYQFSLKLAALMAEEFDRMVRRMMRRLGYKDPSAEEIQRFIDDREIGGNSDCQIDLPTVESGQRVRLNAYFVGECPPFCATLSGVRAVTL